MTTSLKSTAHILHGNPRLHSLLQQAQNLSQLQALVHQYLAPAAREQLRLGGYENGLLTLVLNDAAWATRLRYQQEQLVQQLRQHDPFAGLLRIRLKVRPASNHPEPAETERRYLTANASEHIRQSAEQIEDPQLRAALKRLAQNIRPE